MYSHLTPLRGIRPRHSGIHHGSNCPTCIKARLAPFDWRGRKLCQLRGRKFEKDNDTLLAQTGGQQAVNSNAAFLGKYCVFTQCSLNRKQENAKCRQSFLSRMLLSNDDNASSSPPPLSQCAVSHDHKVVIGHQVADRLPIDESVVLSGPFGLSTAVMLRQGARAVPEDPASSLAWQATRSSPTRLPRSPRLLRPAGGEGREQPGRRPCRSCASLRARRRIWRRRGSCGAPPRGCRQCQRTSRRQRNHGGRRASQRP